MTQKYYHGTIEYHRNPTKDEIAFGYGAIHYIEVEVKKVMNNGKLKKWFVASDGLRYYK